MLSLFPSKQAEQITDIVWMSSWISSDQQIWWLKDMLQMIPLWLYLALLGLLIVWLVLQCKISRTDSDLIKKLHPYRRMMFYIMPKRNESVVYFDAYFRADELLRYLDLIRERFHEDITHCLVAAVAVGLRENPEMNRFVVGHRVYQRRGNWVTFSMKRQKKDKRAKLSAVKKLIPPDITFEQLCASIQSEIVEQRSDKITSHDREYNLLSLIPRPLLKLGVSAIRWLDYHNILPGSFIRQDPMYTSAFIANLGSVGMDPGYHHLYEWGTCSHFLMVGQIADRPVIVDGQVTVQKSLHIRFTYDERIDDGLTAHYGIRSFQRVLEDPVRYLGCVQANGSDTFPIGQPPNVQ
jgi:hypothetical protein